MRIGAVAKLWRLLACWEVDGRMGIGFVRREYIPEVAFIF